MGTPLWAADLLGWFGTGFHVKREIISFIIICTKELILALLLVLFLPHTRILSHLPTACPCAIVPLEKAEQNTLSNLISIPHQQNKLSIQDSIPLAWRILKFLAFLCVLFIFFKGCLTDSDYEPTAALLLDALRMSPERAVLVKNGCLALASLVRLSGNIQQFCLH